jgi:hypothetical protein
MAPNLFAKYLGHGANYIGTATGHCTFVGWLEVLMLCLSTTSSSTSAIVQVVMPDDQDEQAVCQAGNMICWWADAASLWGLAY